MNTIYDYLSVGWFGAIAYLFIYREINALRNTIAVAHYLGPAIGLAAFDLLGNGGHPFLAGASAAFSALYAYCFLIDGPTEQV